MEVRVRLGPIDANSARVYLDYAAGVLAALEDGAAADVAVDPALASMFRRYLAEWRRLTESSGTFRWDGLVDRDELASVSVGWLELMSRLSGRFEELGLAVGPPEGEEFYHHLVEILSAALAADADLGGDKLREAWPALGSVHRSGEGERPGDRRAVRVVLADDSADLRLVLRIALQQDGRFDVVGEAGDGQAVVDICERLRPDLVLLDIVMPAVDGWMALAEIRERFPETKVVMVSSMEAATVTDRALAAGAVGCVQKSTSLESMSATLVELAG